MAENEDNRTAQPGEEELPENFRPVVPEPEIRRRSVYYFSKNFPENDSPTSTHTLSFAQVEFRRKLCRNILFAFVLLIVFVGSFVATDAAIRVSREPIPPTTAHATEPQTAPPPVTEEQSAAVPSSEGETEPPEDETEPPTTVPRTKPPTTVPKTTAAPTTAPETTTAAPETTTVPEATTAASPFSFFGF